MWKAFQDGQMGMEAGMSQTVGGRQDRAEGLLQRIRWHLIAGFVLESGGSSGLRCKV